MPDHAGVHDLNLATRTPQGSVPSQYAKSLTTRDFRVQVASLGQARTITRSLLQRVLGDLDPHHISIERLYQMRRAPMIQMGLYYRKAPIMRAKWHVECEGRPDIAAAIDQTIRERWGSYLRIALQKYDFGFKGAIKRFEPGVIDAMYENEQGSVVPAWKSKNVKPVILDRPIPLPAEYARVKLNENTGAFEGIEVSLPFSSRNPKDNIVPAEHAIWIPNEFEESDNNWYGYPLLGYSYLHWWSSRWRHHMEDRHFEQKADPPLVVDYPEGKYVDPTGRVHQNRDLALAMGNELRGGATIAKPSTLYKDPDSGALRGQPLWDATFLTGGDNMSTFQASAEYLDIMQLRGLLVPEQALIEGIQGSGSRATSGVHASLFGASLEQESDEIASLFNKRVIPQLVEANWGPDVPACRMVMDGQDESTLSFLQSLVTTAFTLDPNALPIKWETILEQVDVPTYTAKEQEERDQLAQEQALEAQEQALNDPNAEPPPVEGQQTKPTPNAPGVNNLGQYFKQREVIHLHQGSKKVSSKRAPGWAHEEGARRERNTQAVAERLRESSERFYRDAFEEVAAEFAGAELAQGPGVGGLGTVGTVQLALTLAADAVRRVASRFLPSFRGELASLYHAGGSAELTRLGLNAETFDVGMDEVQDWAREHAGELIVTLSQTVVEQHLRPFLTEKLQEPLTSTELAQQISEKFEGYPRWMAERVARTEARNGYNLSSADMWERIGVQNVVMFDGLGGKSGVTDAECLRRNGETVPIDEFREENANEHPNGTLGAVPDMEDITLEDPHFTPVPAGVSFAQSDSIYAIDETGRILTQDETGILLASL